MASIAYVCQHEMIEFHRLRGHNETVFLRLSNKKFTRFDTNDLLFFLTKTFHRPERGVVGFGVLSKQELSSSKSLWRKYKEKTGYADEQEMVEALEKMSKSEEIPKKISGLHLKDVVYFESPIYLSEFGFQLEPNLESFTYIDQTQDLTSKILDAVKFIGVDLWSQTQNQSISKHDLDIILKRHVLSRTCDQFNLLSHTTNKTISNKLIKLSDKLQLLPNTRQIYTLVVDDNLICYIPLLRKSTEAINELIGISCTLSRVSDQHPLIENPKIKVVVYGSGELKKAFKKQLELFNIQYLNVNKEFQ